ncbi:replication-associated recombination protein A [Alteromonas sp. a30]|uniref:replication-associated recombination protein A n=1 Tax=Alteromonas sp. a30 TaxID=2730917 RepID=UPI0022811FDE|nr:replication-associated recombination protein A [Alteromonas sp. a30]MCY7295125.1 replication-associated recombination protein A [Alteromonas sp. a30]
MSLSLNFGEVSQPLAALLRPKSIDNYVGQQHIVGEDKPLYRALMSGQAHSMILWGPPGTGKTTLAEIVAHSIDAHVEKVSAVTGGIKEIRAAIDNAKQQAQDFGRKTILFVDEVHRFNKAQQDAFLPFIEDGTVVFIGATTENPSFELNNALLSRTRVYVLKSLEEEDLAKLLERALDSAESLQNTQLNQEATQALIAVCDGDARRMLNILEIAAQLASGAEITKQDIAQASGDKLARFDKGGDHYYDLLSAFHKSVRGSSPDAALYWFSRLLVAGSEVTAIARRLLAIASEDIGNADPRALQVTLNAWDIYHRVGAAEGERAIAQAVVYCASAPKSNAVYKAFKSAMALAKETVNQPIPMHIRNAPTQLLKDIGANQGYRYAHDETYAYAAGDNYLPEAIKDAKFYQPEARGMEKQIKARLDFLQELDQQSDKKRYD